MSERKYRQRGYQDSDRDRPQGRGQPKPKTETFGPRTPNLPGAHSVVRCAACGTILPLDFDPSGKCPRCGFELHSCKQCAYFDTSARFECTQPIPERIPRKDARNFCQYYAPRTTIERQTSPERQTATLTGRPVDARQAFENLFKK